MKLPAGHRSNNGTPTVTDGHDHDIVELTRVAFVAEAIAIRQNLERVGIRAAVMESDAGGWAPRFGIDQGNRVMVRAMDLVAAQRLLSDDGGQVALVPQPTPPTFKKHIRRRGDV